MAGSEHQKLPPSLSCSSSSFLTKPFTILEPQNPEINKLYVAKNCRSTDPETLNWSNVRSGSSLGQSISFLDRQDELKGQTVCRSSRGLIGVQMYAGRASSAACHTNGRRQHCLRGVFPSLWDELFFRAATM